jgi:RHS repeat-associated protein
VPGLGASDPTYATSLDQTDPGLSLSISYDPAQAHLDESGFYYRPVAGTYTVTAYLTDTLAGLETLTFPTTTSPGDTYDAWGGATTATQAHLYTTDAADTFSDLVQIEATDRAGNLSSYLVNVVNDDDAPTPVITVQSTVSLKFTVAWDATDNASGVQYYDVQYKQGAGSWTDWLTNTTTTNAQFIGQQDESYTFRVQATDNVGNVSAWQESTAVTIDAITKYYHHGSSRVAMRQGGEVYYLHGDHLGSTSLTTDDQGGVVYEARYLPFGEERWVDGEGVTDFTFTGQRQDGFGLMDYNARYYSSYLNRFVSPDPIISDYKNPQSLNRYAYTLNNPVRFTDPTGHYTFEEEPDDLLFVPPKRYPQFNPTDEAMRKSDFRCIADCPPSKGKPDAILIGGVGSIDLLPTGVSDLADTNPLVNNVIKKLERYNISFNYIAGLEVMYHLETNEWDVFFFHGFEESGLGAGGNGAIYVGGAYNLDDLGSYVGPFRANTVTGSAGVIGGTASYFWDPNPQSDLHGYSIGWAPGARYSIATNQTNYTSLKEATTDILYGLAILSGAPNVPWSNAW